MAAPIFRRLSLIVGFVCLASLIALDWAIPTPLFYSPYPIGPASWSITTQDPILLKRNLGLLLTLIVVAVNFFAVVSKRYSIREKYCACGAIGMLIGFLLQPAVTGFWLRPAPWVLGK